MSPRKPNMESSVYFGADGWWHGRVTMGVKNDGSPDRRHRRGKTETEVRRKVRALEALRDKGRAPKAGRKPTVAQWMETYLTEIASLKLKPRSLDDYWSKTRNDIIPGVGQHRLDKLAPEHLERMYRAMLDEGHAPRTSSKCTASCRAHSRLPTAAESSARTSPRWWTRRPWTRRKPIPSPPRKPKPS